MSEGQAQWFVVIGEAPKGPTTLDGILAYFQTGQADRTSLVWREGMAEWLPLGQIPEFQSYLAPRPIGEAPLDSHEEGEHVDWTTRTVVGVMIVFGLFAVGGVVWAIDYYGNGRYGPPGAEEYQPPDEDWVWRNFGTSGHEMISDKNMERARQGAWVPVFANDGLMPGDVDVNLENTPQVPAYGLQVHLFEVEALTPEIVSGYYYIEDGTEMQRWKVRRYLVRRPASGAAKVGAPADDYQEFIVYTATETANGEPYTIWFTEPEDIGYNYTNDAPTASFTDLLLLD